MEYLYIFIAYPYKLSQCRMSAISPFRTYNAHTGGRLQYVKFGTFSASAARISAEYIDRKTWRIYNLDKKTWQRGTLWKKKISWRSAAEKTKTETWQRQKCPRKPAALPAASEPTRAASFRFYLFGLLTRCFSAHLLLLILGIFLSTLGTVNIKGNISTIHSYNRRKVKEEDVPKYGKAVGTGTLVIGVSLVLSYLVTFWNADAIDYIVLPALVIGLAFILYGQIKYNHGIF